MASFSVYILPLQHQKIKNTARMVFSFLRLALTVQKMKFSIKDIFLKCDQSRWSVRTWSHFIVKICKEKINVLSSDTIKVQLLR